MATDSTIIEKYCLGCGYSLHGLPINRCPECGREFDPANPRTFSIGQEALRARRVQQSFRSARVFFLVSIVLLTVDTILVLGFSYHFLWICLFQLVAFGLLGSLIAFGYAAWRCKPQDRLKYVGWCLAALIMPAVWLVAVPTTGDYLVQRRVERTRGTIQTLVTDIERIRSKLGRLPKDEQELASWLGKPMPWSEFGRPIRYEPSQKDPIHYKVTSFTLMGIAEEINFEFDSQQSRSGVTYWHH